MIASPTQCHCVNFDRLEGAATQAYITQFLKIIGGDKEAIYYQCRTCETNWKKTEESKRPSLIQIKEP